MVGCGERIRNEDRRPPVRRDLEDGAAGPGDAQVAGGESLSVRVAEGTFGAIVE